MVLWEITLGTAYFLGLKRTYRLALRIQRRLVSPNRPKVRNFLQRRTRAAFDVALRVHQNIQQRDLEVGRNLGNWILRWLDRMKPSAQIRGTSPLKPPSSNVKMTKQTSSSSQLKTPGSIQSRNQDSGRHLFTGSRNTWSKPFPTIAMIMRPPRPAGTITQYRHLFIRGPEMASTSYIGGARGFEGVIRKDIMQYMLQH
ncbi:uncharacterized protein LOC8278502 [Ricinus communis]|uniref:Uncharacterized protein n=1 Tax=Ricinus communis TaxID=3988 RepID=B9RZ05_RICCO|nr:uncharacterized protein LOC8278502 [Ricinus communis]EEF43507.1 conserved hypothetical protein [Ricinus communis]|eukprot:XP_002518974.1 uncharacterized protein LOC8278502 [Ricinus communis]